MSKKKGHHLTGLIFGLIFLIGLGILAYPTISNQWNTWRNSRLIASYQDTVDSLSAEDAAKYWEAAVAYNSTLSGFGYSDAFSDSSKMDEAYWSVLNVNGDGIMGYISIPKINIKIAIYHGTADDVLLKGAGHLAASNLPIGGEGNHAVLAAHRGLASARLFTDLDQMEYGDEFYLYILDDVLAYQVDQILPMVDKDDVETLTQAMEPVEGEDYVTLLTCTPYGVNSHRLLVRGHRVPYEGEEEKTLYESILHAIQNYYALFLILGLAIVVLCILIVRYLLNRTERKKKISEETHEG